MAQPDWLVCVHEGGHIAAAYLRGGRIKSINVDPNGGILGEVHAEFYNRDWRSLVIFCMAGFWAQHHIYGMPYPWDYARIDKAEWERTLRVHGATRGAEERCFRTAEQIVLDHEELILAIATRLQQGHDKDQICSYLQDVSLKGSHGQYTTGARRRN